MDAAATAGEGVSAITEQVASISMLSDDGSNVKAEMNLDDLDALGEKLYEKLVALQGLEQSKFAKQGIQLLLASGLLELYKERQSQQSQPPSPDPASAAAASSATAAPMVQSPSTITSNTVPLYSNTSPMSSISSAASGSSYGMPNIRQRESSNASTSSVGTPATSTYSPATTHTRSFSSSSSSHTTSPSLSSTPSMRRSNRRSTVKILDIGTGQNGTIATLLTLMAEEGLIHPKEELEITASEMDKAAIKLLKEKFKPWRHVTLRSFTPEAMPCAADNYRFAFQNMGMHWVQDEDSVLSQMYRVVLPGGTVGFTSFQSIGYESSGPENVTDILPNSGWSSPARIHKKLLKHGFTDIQIYEYRYPHQWEKVNKTGKQVIQFIIEHAMKKLWKDENDAEMDLDTKCAMREQLMGMFENGDCTGDVVALITLAKKPESQTQAGVSYF